MMDVVLKICISVVVFEVIKIITPSGNFSKFTDSVYSVVLVIMIFNIVTGFDSIPALDFDISSNVSYEDTYEKDVSQEYQKRIKAKICEKCKADAAIEFDGYSIKSVVFEEDPGIASINYLINELGVDRNDITVRKNQ